MRPLLILIALISFQGISQSDREERGLIGNVKSYEIRNSMIFGDSESHFELERVQFNQDGYVVQSYFSGEDST